MGKDEELTLAKRSYTAAKEEGNRQEEAKWANVIAHIHKNRGEYVKALKWLRYDYNVSVKYLPEKHLLPTCQSLGELHLRLQHFSDALFYQKKHLQLAKDANDLIEQQRASTQLGRTYHEMLLKSDDDHYSVRNAKKYFRLAMKLAQSLKENQPTNRFSFLKEYIDAHNNIGMLEKDLDNFEEAKRFLIKGLEICDEEEVGEVDDSRSRLHHNLGSVYMELRLWDKAMEHIEKDITICQRIGHIQGEAKGYINLGELHYRFQKYVDTIRCYKKALELAKSLEDEDALVEQIDQNIEIVEKAMHVMDEIKKEEQSLKKLTRNMVTAKGTPRERKCLLQQNCLLDHLIEKSSTIFAWWKHREYAKRKKRIATLLFDKEKLSDSFLVLGESYQQLRNFKKAVKWFNKSWDMYKSIGHLEGQALAKINLGDALDSDGDWMGALHAFEEGYRIAIGANLPSIQLSALENMHYSNMMRFDNIEEARRLQLQIDKLKQSKSKELEVPKLPRDCCSETDTDEDDRLSDSKSTTPCAPDISGSPSSSRSLAAFEDLNDNAPLVSLVKSSRSLPRQKATQFKHHYIRNNQNGHSLECMFQKSNTQQKLIGRKRVRLVLSDDDAEMHEEVDCLSARIHEYSDDNADDPILDQDRKETNPSSSSCRFQDCSTLASRHATSSCCPINIESANSYKYLNPKMAPGKDLRSSSNDLPSDIATSVPKYNINDSENTTFGDNASHLQMQILDTSNTEYFTFRLDKELINVDVDSSFFDVDELSMESLKVELACIYYLRLPPDKRSNGLLPIIQHIKCSGRLVESMEEFHTLKENHGRLPIELSINGWLQKRIMRLYLDCCEELNEIPNMKLLKKLYISEVEDEVSASDCELQDISITPLLNALHTHKSVALLDLSHNLLGIGTMEKLRQFFTSGQKYGDLTLDLHCNRFGPTALFQICECPVLFTRLEVLNISGNRLTDACGSYLLTILEKCKALYSLNVECCSITSRTVQKIADALNADSVLAHLSIGYNNPISGTSLINLLAKLATLRSFTELNLTGVKLIKAGIDSLCQLVKISSISCLMLGRTDVGTDAALQLMESFIGNSEESVKLDLSYCGIKSMYISKLCTDFRLIRGITELNLGGNPIHQQGEDGLVSLLMNHQCRLKVLVLSKCQLGFAGILQVIHALEDNDHLEELYLADNNDLDKKDVLLHETRNSGILHSKISPSGKSKVFEANEVGVDHQDICAVNANCNQLEVADSEDDVLQPKAAPSELDDSCTSSCQKNQSLDYQCLQELSAAVCMAKQLRLLDLSNNGFSIEVADELYTAWTSRSARGLSCCHIKDDIIHFSMDANKCCRVKYCCRKE